MMKKLGLAIALLVFSNAAWAGTASTAYPACASTEVPYDLVSQTQKGADGFAWGTFLAYLGDGSKSPVWSSWPSTVDLINCNQGHPAGRIHPAGGTCDNGRFVPTACTDEYNKDRSVLILDEVSKVDDDFLEADSSGLSSNPVLDSNGNFLRFVIVMSPETQRWLLSPQQPESTFENLVSPVVFPCSSSSDKDSNKSSTILKLAWMDATGLDPSTYYIQDVLVYTPAYRNATKQASCEKQSRALVGMHLLRKTQSQPAWVWGTFEHALNAPDCAGLPFSGNQGGSKNVESAGPATSCPSTVSKDWNFYSKSCQADNTEGVCQNCNTVPAENGGAENCTNNSAGGNWCLDQSPNPTQGLSRLCRQIAPGDYYKGATKWDDTPPNAACQPKSGVWSNYQLISTQWAVLNLGSDCPNVQARIYSEGSVAYGDFSPAIADLKDHTFLGNTSMESYERSNCVGCHSRAAVGNSAEVNTSGTDFVYFLDLEVPGFEAVRGCADGTAEATSGSIQACSGTFSQPGIDNPKTVGTAASLCAESWHICTLSEVESCDGIDSFYAAAASGPGNRKCGVGDNDLFGCGSVGDTPDTGCGQLNRASGDLCHALSKTDWSCGSDDTKEFVNVTKPGSAGGGVLCCPPSD